LKKKSQLLQVSWGKKYMVYSFPKTSINKTAEF
jgi:hypothetical protein